MDNLIYSWALIYCKSICLWIGFCAIVLFYTYLEASSAFGQFLETFTDNLSSHTFDYIVVGGGTAGSLLAARLSEQKDASVLLLEAGSPLPFFLDIPALGALVQRSAYDWQYKTEPQDQACFALDQKRSRWPIGRGLGGSSQLNYLLHVPGHIGDFVTWQPASNRSKTNPGSLDNETIHWSEEDVRRYFVKAQSVSPVREVPYSTSLSLAVLSAARALGFEIDTADLDSSSSFGKNRVYLTASGSRWTPADYLLQVKKNRANLIVKTGATVTKLLIKDNAVYGVEVSMSGVAQTIFSSKEVILSAGAIGSPLLLMRSGIGPKKMLESSQIDCILDLPVGKNLQDHVTTGLDLIISRNHLLGISDLISPTSFYNYFCNGNGALASTLCEAVGVFKSKSSKLPDLEFLVMMAGASSDYGLLAKNHIGIRDNVWRNYFEPLFDHSTASILPVLLHPKSVGDISLNPKNPSGPLLINPNYLSDPADVETLVDGLQLIQKLVTNPEMQSKGFFMNDQIFPGCEGLTFGERSYWRCYVRQLTLTSYHPVGTCKMGAKEDSTVVDHRLRVHGLSGLRVVDASVMPTLLSGNPQAAVLMIAEKAADLIKFDNRETT